MYCKDFGQRYWEKMPKKLLLEDTEQALDDGYSTSGSACDLQRLYINPVSARPFCPQTA